MALYSDMNGFPESGFPVLADMEDRLCLNTLHYYPIKHLGFKLDVLGNNRLLGALVLGGSLTGVTSIAMAGALTGATTIDASGTVTLSSAAAPLNITGASAVVNITGADSVLNMPGINSSVGTDLFNVAKGFFKNLKIKNRPECGAEDAVALVSDLVKFTFDPPQEFEFADVVAGTAKDYTLIIKAKYAFRILSVCLETDNGTLTGVAVKINSTAVTSLSSITVDTAVDETDATGANIAVPGDRVYLSVAATYTGTPTLIRGSLITRRL